MSIGLQLVFSHQHFCAAFTCCLSSLYADAHVQGPLGVCLNSVDGFHISEQFLVTVLHIPVVSPLFTLDSQHTYHAVHKWLRVGQTYLGSHFSIMVAFIAHMRYTHTVHFYRNICLFMPLSNQPVMCGCGRGCHPVTLVENHSMHEHVERGVLDCFMVRRVHRTTFACYKTSII